MASSEVPPPVEPSSLTTSPLHPAPSAPHDIISDHMDTALPTDEFQRCLICGLPGSPTSFNVGPEESFGWSLFAGSSMTRCMTCRSFPPCGMCIKVVTAGGQVPSSCAWCRKLSDVYRASAGEAASASTLKVPDVRRKRRAEEDLEDVSKSIQPISKQGPKLEDTSETLQERIRFTEPDVKQAREKETVPALDTPTVGAADNHMDVEPEGSLLSSDDGSQSGQASQVVGPVAGWSFGRGVRQLLGMEPPKSEKPKKTVASRTRKAVAATSAGPSGSSRKRRRHETEAESEESGPPPVVKIEPDSDAGFMDSEESDDAHPSDEASEGVRSKLSHQGSQDTIRGTIGQDRASRFRAAPASSASGSNKREKRVKREHDSTSPEPVPGAFRVIKEAPVSSDSSHDDLVTLPKGHSLLPIKSSKADVVSKAMTLISNYGTAALPPFEGVLGETLAESSKAGTSNSRKGKEREELPFQSGAGSLDWNIAGLDDGNVKPKSVVEDEANEKAKLIEGFQTKSRQLASMVKFKTKN